jgi:hypothetical protein
MSVSQIRFSAIAITALFAIGLRDYTTWASAVLSIGFGHYLLSLWYARAKLAKVASDFNTALPMAAAVAGGAVLYFNKFPLIVYFAVHHVFNEVYLTTGALKHLTVSQQKVYRTIAMPLQTLLYFYLLRTDPKISFLDGPALLGTLIVAYACYFGLLFRLRKSLAARDLVEISTFEVAGLCMLAVSFIVPIRFLDIVCYHFVFWWFYPATKLAAKGSGAVRGYLIQTATLIVVSFLLSPAGLIGDYPFRNSMFLKQFILWSHIHITSSFFLSTAHPTWITRWFIQHSARAAGRTRALLGQEIPT